jgi:REP element-mobilizing transposase RayT
MSTYTQILYQIVFSTKKWGKTLNISDRDKLYRFIWGVLKNKKCHVYRIGGVEDHLHILTHIHPEVALSSLVKDIQLASSSFIKSENIFPHFTGWQNGYGDSLIQYPKRKD